MILGKQRLPQRKSLGHFCSCPRPDGHCSFPQLLSLLSRFGHALGSKAASPVPKGRGGKLLISRCGFRLGRSKSMVGRKACSMIMRQGCLPAWGKTHLRIFIFASSPARKAMPGSNPHGSVSSVGPYAKRQSQARFAVRQFMPTKDR